MSQQLSTPATARNLARLVSRAWRVRVTGSHLVPTHGPVILAANHTAFLDVLVLSGHAPRPVRMLVDAATLQPPFGAAVLAAGHLPYGEGPDRAALRLAQVELEAGGIVGIFPEGRRGDGAVRHVHHDVAYLAAVTGAPVVPVALLGTRPLGGAVDALPRLRDRIDVVFGEPIDIRVDGDQHRRAVLARSGERVRQVLADHVRTACQRTGQTLPGPIHDLIPAAPRSHP